MLELVALRNSKKGSYWRGSSAATVPLDRQTQRERGVFHNGQADTEGMWNVSQCTGQTDTEERGMSPNAVDRQTLRERGMSPNALDRQTQREHGMFHNGQADTEGT